MSGSTPLIHQDFSCDNQGNLKSLTDHQNPAFSLSNLNYDGLDRLTGITSRWGKSNSQSGTISYDGFGNILTYKVGDTNLTYNYSNNRLTTVKNSTGQNAYSFNYDSRGNVTNNDLRSFNFNRAGQLNCSGLSTQAACAAGTNRYLYDGHNRRVKTVDATGTSYSLYSQDGTLLLNHKNGYDTYFVYLGQKLIAQLDDPNAPQQTNTRRHNLPYGESIEAPSNTIGYTGHKYALVYCSRHTSIKHPVLTPTPAWFTCNNGIWIRQLADFIPMILLAMLLAIQ